MAVSSSDLREIIGLYARWTRLRLKKRTNASEKAEMYWLRERLLEYGVDDFEEPEVPMVL